MNEPIITFDKCSDDAAIEAADNWHLSPISDITNEEEKVNNPWTRFFLQDLAVQITWINATFFACFWIH